MQQLNYNVSTGVAVWTITSLDPATMEEVTDLYRGVLPINYDGSGMGRVSFSIQRKANPSCFTAANTTSLSRFNASLAYPNP